MLFIALTQYLFFYAILFPLLSKQGIHTTFNFLYLSLLVISSVFIAGAGNIINDYFDLNIDIINKPHKVIIGKYIHRHWAISAHIVLSIAGIIIGLYLDKKTNTFLLGFTNAVCVCALFIYSVVLKRKPLSGNILISLLTAWTVGVVTFSQTKILITQFNSENIQTLTRITILYASFAFIISFIREMVKDAEDMEGDRKYNCRTFPILFGIPATKIFIYVWVFILIALLIILIFYILPFRWWLGIIYIIIFILIPLFNIFKMIRKAHTSGDFNDASNYIKMVMFTGIYSMIFFWYYS